MPTGDPICSECGHYARQCTCVAMLRYPTDLERRVEELERRVKFLEDIVIGLDKRTTSMIHLGGTTTKDLTSPRVDWTNYPDKDVR